jgi:hypothetical protein
MEPCVVTIARLASPRFRYEARVPHCAASGGVPRGSANITGTAATRYRRRDKQFAAHQYRRHLPTRNGRDVLQRGQQPEQRRLWIKWGVLLRPAPELPRLLPLSRPVEKASSPPTSCATEAAPPVVALPRAGRRCAHDGGCAVPGGGGA